MKVSVVRGGGLAGLVETTTADSDRLGADDADSLRRKVAEARFFDLAPQSRRVLGGEGLGIGDRGLHDTGQPAAPYDRHFHGLSASGTRGPRPLSRLR